MGKADIIVGSFNICYETIFAIPDDFDSPLYFHLEFHLLFLYEFHQRSTNYFITDINDSGAEYSRRLIIFRKKFFSEKVIECSIINSLWND